MEEVLGAGISLFVSAPFEQNSIRAKTDKINRKHKFYRNNKSLFIGPDNSRLLRIVDIKQSLSMVKAQHL